MLDLLQTTLALCHKKLEGCYYKRKIIITIIDYNQT